MGSFGHVQGGIFMLKRALVCFLILSGWFWFGGPSAHADQAAAPASFTVTPVLPRDNASHIAYFQFPVHPREHRTLSLRVTNQSQQLGAYAVVPRTDCFNERRVSLTGIEPLRAPWAPLAMGAAAITPPLEGVKDSGKRGQWCDG